MVSATDRATAVSGLDLARRLRAPRPELPIRLITGSRPDHAGAQNLDLPGRVPRVILTVSLQPEAIVLEPAKTER